MEGVGDNQTMLWLRLVMIGMWIKNDAGVVKEKKKNSEPCGIQSRNWWISGNISCANNATDLLKLKDFFAGHPFWFKRKELQFLKQISQWFGVCCALIFLKSQISGYFLVSKQIYNTLIVKP